MSPLSKPTFCASLVIAFLGTVYAQAPPVGMGLGMDPSIMGAGTSGGSAQFFPVQIPVSPIQLFPQTDILP
ncbi:hypothetical protein BGW38_002221, partial [Lunasporangiospora selenospora]